MSPFRELICWPFAWTKKRTNELNEQSDIEHSYTIGRLCNRQTGALFVVSFGISRFEIGGIVEGAMTIIRAPINKVVTSTSAIERTNERTVAAWRRASSSEFGLLSSPKLLMDRRNLLLWTRQQRPLWAAVSSCSRPDIQPKAANPLKRCEHLWELRAWQGCVRAQPIEPSKSWLERGRTLGNLKQQL